MGFLNIALRLNTQVRIGIKVRVSVVEYHALGKIVVPSGIR